MRRKVGKGPWERCVKIAVMKVGLVVAQRKKNLSELEKHALTSKNVDLLLFPEGYFKAEQLDEVSRIVAGAKKWLVCSYSEERKKDRHEIGAIFNRRGKLVGSHVKTVLTRTEINDGYLPGKDIKVVKTEFGKIGICVCFEMHFPEIAREYKLQGARAIFNPIGNGMYDEEQFKAWTAVGRVRAFENGVYTLGCSHFTSAIPLAYTYDKNGVELLKKRNKAGMFVVEVPIEKMTRGDDNSSQIRKRTPRLYRHLRRI